MEESSNGAASAPNVDEIVAQLRARVAERRRSGAYPRGLEDDLADHFRRILRHRVEPHEPPDLRHPLQAVQKALPLEAARIPADSTFPGGQALHRAIAKVVGRQTQGALEQVQAFAQPVEELLEVLVAAVEGLSREVHVDLARHIDAIYERLATQEREMAHGDSVDARNLSRLDGGLRRQVFHPWYSSERFEEEFRGPREEILERYRDLAQRLRECQPVLDGGCGRGEFLELLGELGITAWGIDLDAELVKGAVERGLNVEHGDGLRFLERLDDSSLGGIVLIQVVEHLSAQEIVDFVALAADKVRPGGRVLVETVNPQSLYVYARALYLDPTHLRPVHPAYLSFLFREAGFASVGIDWRSPPPSDEVLEELPDETNSTAPTNANVRRLNQLLFAPQDYLLAATR